MSTPEDINTPDVTAVAPVVGADPADQQAIAAAAAAQDQQTRELATLIQQTPYNFQPVTGRKATVVSVEDATTPTLTLNLSGDTQDIAGVTFLNSYSPSPGDVVEVQKQGTDIIVVGKMAKWDDIGPSWILATMNTGWGHNGGSGGNVYFRRRWVGGWIVEFKGHAARTSGSTIMAAGALPVGYRPAQYRVLIAARGNGNPGGFSMATQVIFNPDGSVTYNGDNMFPVVQTVDPVDNTTSVDPADDTSYNDAGWSNNSDAGWSGGDSPLVTGTPHSHYTGAHSHYTGSHNHGVLGAHSHGVTGSHTHTLSLGAPDWISFNGLSYFT